MRHIRAVATLLTVDALQNLCDYFLAAESAFALVGDSALALVGEPALALVGDPAFLGEFEPPLATAPFSPAFFSDLSGEVS